MKKQIFAATCLAMAIIALVGFSAFGQANGDSVVHQVQATSTLEPRVYLPLVLGNYPSSFELGGWVKDWDLPYASRMHYAGMNWVKSSVYYPQDASSIIAVAHNNGFKIQLDAYGASSMVTQPNFEQDYANWVSSLAMAGADAIEVWNEPNINRNWPTGYISPTLYTSLLCTSYNAIKAVYSDTLVISDT